MLATALLVVSGLAVFLGKKLVSHYGCMSCHAINGAEQMTSPCAKPTIGSV